MCRKQWQEKKGGKNKYGYRPARGKAQPSSSRSMETATTSGPLYSEIHHNENKFELMFLVEGAKRCKSCHLDFCHRKKVIPFDVIFSHKERWMYPINGDWSNCKPSQRKTVRYYHASMKCLISRFPYFTADYICIPSDVEESLRDSHKKLSCKWVWDNLRLNFPSSRASPTVYASGLSTSERTKIDG